ncbi:GNAT family N-acetyltransferase [Streptomyces sp. A3M-1-3]|uniref:GNAT family N-acetyltransferase n=1 Tax=Streptomyces sp. A3M-1-3 TaxID=2962044 RepID=UPI0020B70FF6|nr:GNAT family N-acetyltransferase [Streptomyces sp. A3M-1-3]MCP3817495.1 GNAT family N-acetyltransferase [Streptomyces sp. A3M-1-3]
MIDSPKITLRHTADSDAGTLVALYDRAARWMRDNSIDQWKPGEKDSEHFRERMRTGEVWLAEADGRPCAAYELWWSDEAAWGVQPPVAGYVHRLMIDRTTAPRGLGRRVLGHAELRIGQTGREFARLDCLSSNPRLRTYYEAAGYRVAGEHPSKEAADGSTYAVVLLEKRLPRRP